MRILDWIKNLIIVGFVLLALVAVVANFNLPLRGYRLLVVQSGSMEPSIGVSSIVLTKPTSDFVSPVNEPMFSNGDVITFKNGSSLVSHRAVAVKKESGQFLYQTKGDANKSPDSSLVAEKKVVGKVIAIAPGVGRLVNFAKTPIGYFLMILIPSLYVIISELFVLWNELKRTSTSISFNGNAALPVIILIFGGFYFVGGTASYFSDTSTSTNNTFSASSIFTNHVVISEVQVTGGPGEADNDFVELYNPTSIPFNLNGHRLVKRTGSAVDSTIKSWTSTAIIPAHGYYLWATTDDGFNIVLGADAATAENIAANNSIALRFGSENTGTIVDALSWHSSTSSLVEGTEFGTNPGPNESIERRALSTSTAVSMAISGSDEFKGNGFDSNDNSADFILRSVSQPQNSSSATETP